jgi:enterochelin esterase-like enzyme
VELDVWSSHLGGSVRLVATRPRAGLQGAPLVWLLHGRGASYVDVGRIVADLEAAMESGSLGPHTIIAPWVPWLDGAAWWVDSRPPGGCALESAILHDVLPQVEDRWEPGLGRDRRIVAGYSMGGGAAIRWVLAHGDLFGAAAVAAPAAYADAPPADSSARWSGAFKLGTDAFDHDTWERLMSYQRLLAERGDDDEGSTSVAIVVGDQEAVQAYPEGRSSLTLEAARLHATLMDSEAVSSALRVVDGGHTDEFWAPALATALDTLSAHRRPARIETPSQGVPTT